MKVKDENSRIRIHWSDSWIRKSGSKMSRLHNTGRNAVDRPTPVGTGASLPRTLALGVQVVVLGKTLPRPEIQQKPTLNSPFQCTLGVCLSTLPVWTKFVFTVNRTEMLKDTRERGTKKKLTILSVLANKLTTRKVVPYCAWSIN